MTKISFFLTTLLAAIPAAFLAWLCVAAFLFHADALTGTLMGLVGLTLLLSVVVAALPVAVLLKKGGPKPAKATAAKADEAAEPEDAGWDQVEPSEDEDEAIEDDPFAEDDKK